MTQSPDSDTLTEGIRVRVAAKYLELDSDPDRGQYVYAYRVHMQNEGDEPARLLTRHWIVRDADNEISEHQGPGVVGEYPHLAPGESFEYMSRCPLATSWGTMEGVYSMERDDGRAFDVRIGRFFLAQTVAPLETLAAD